MSDPTVAPEDPATAGRRPLLTVSGQQFWLALVIIIGDFIIIGMLFFVNIPTDNERIIDIALGVILGAGGTVAAFYFPSSVGARSKDEAINKLTDLVHSALGGKSPQP